MSLLIRDARVLMAFDSPPPPRGPLRGKAMNEWPVLDRADVLIENGVIAHVGTGGPRAASSASTVIDAAGRVLMPGLIDCHTHACWAGDRLDEWELKRAGVPYLDILKRGGGIMSTVRAVRATSQSDLAALLRVRLARMLSLGSTTIEVKSGYGLSTVDELKMLRAIAEAARDFPGTIVPTALIGHAIDADALRHSSAAAFVDRTINETLPAISSEFTGIAIDAYCEEGAWTLDDCRRLFERARTLGHPIRVHADQFNELGIIGLNSEWSAHHNGFRSIDHLEATGPASLAALAKTMTIGTLLPCTGFHTDGRYANGRALIDHGGAVALATNANPGTSPCFSMPMAVALAVRFNKLTIREAIAAATLNAAATVGLADRGYIAPGARGDLVLLNTADERLLAYEFGDCVLAAVIANGQICSKST